MPNAITMLENEIKELIALPVGSERAPYLDRVEQTLTDGYAHALQLEGERWRLQRRLGEIAASVDSTGTSELPRIARRLSATDGDLARLRGMLMTLKQRAEEVRAAA